VIICDIERGDKMQGQGAVNGMAYASAYIINEIKLNINKIDNSDVGRELKKLQTAKIKCSRELEAIIESSKNVIEDENIEIFNFQLLLLEDINFYGKIEQAVSNEKINCEYAVESIANNYKEYLEGLDNEYLRERSSDIEDIKKRLLYHILDIKEANLNEEGDEFIIVTTDMTPTELIKINKNRLKGIILEKGGLSSHCAILSRAMGIPFIINLKDATGLISQGKMVLMNGFTGEVTVSPDGMQLREYCEYKVYNLKENADLEEYKHRETVTKDGRRMKVFANITSEKEINDLILQGGEGVGLFRTEMMYMEHEKSPDEERQFVIYSKIATKLKGRPLVIRTLDAGGDKNIGYLNIPKEDNPFLGYRAIRYCLANPEIFKEQIAAILRAGQFGDIRMMVPMITTISEIEQVTALVKEVKKELREKGVGYAENLKIGMMMETPAAAVLADKFAGMVDFFSIGSNDLTQYLFAADRNNELVSNLNSYYHPALIRVMKYICKGAQEKNIEVDICGQAGEVVELIPLWIAMGVDNLSVSIPSITKVRKAICSFDKTECERILDKVINFNTAGEVKRYLKERKDDNKEINSIE
jgi:phosphotransferase system enzyme I (PtsI)